MAPTICDEQKGGKVSDENSCERANRTVYLYSIWFGTASLILKHTAYIATECILPIDTLNLSGWCDPPHPSQTIESTTRKVSPEKSTKISQRQHLRYIYIDMAVDADLCVLSIYGTAYLNCVRVQRDGVPIYVKEFSADTTCPKYMVNDLKPSTRKL